jgi:hypothetical protein
MFALDEQPSLFFRFQRKNNFYDFETAIDRLD